MSCCAVLRWALISVISVLRGSTAWSANQYWDSNGTAAGAGVTPTGTWGSANFWNEDFAGTSATTGYTSGSIATFAAGTDATAAYTVTVSGTQTVSGLTFEEGTVTLSGGTLSLSGAVIADTTGSAKINSVISGSGSLIKSNSGTLTLAGSNNFFAQ